MKAETSPMLARMGNFLFLPQACPSCNHSQAAMFTHIDYIPQSMKVEFEGERTHIVAFYQAWQRVTHVFTSPVRRDIHVEAARKKMRSELQKWRMVPTACFLRTTKPFSYLKTLIDRE